VKVLHPLRMHVSLAGHSGLSLLWLAAVLTLTGAGLFLAPWPAARAAGPIVVTSLLDDGSPGTLRWAINQANGAAGPDTISFTVTGTVALGGALILVLGVLTWKQARVYADVGTLWQDTLARNPACWKERRASSGKRSMPGGGGRSAGRQSRAMSDGSEGYSPSSMACFFRITPTAFWWAILAIS